MSMLAIAKDCVCVYTKKLNFPSVLEKSYQQKHTMFAYCFLVKFQVAKIALNF